MNKYLKAFYNCSYKLKRFSFKLITVVPLCAQRICSKTPVEA